LSINDVMVNQPASGSTGAIFTVSLSGASGKTVSVDYATADGSALAPGDYSSKNGTLSFAPEETVKTIAVTVNGSAIPQADKTFFVNLSNAANAGVSKAKGTGTIHNQAAAPALSINDVSLFEGNTGTTNTV